MDVDQMSRQIEAEEARLRELMKEMEALVPGIVAAVSTEVVEWSGVAAKNAAEGYFTSNPKRHAELAAKLPKLKQAVDATLARLPSLVEQELNRLGSWAHTSKEALNGLPWTVAEETSRTWWTVARTTYGFIARPLAEHGFVGGREQGDHDLWSHDSSCPGYFTFAYGGSLKAMPERVCIALKPYKERWAEARKRQAAIAVLEGERAKLAFKNTWGK
ncbi:hypothetical protein [Myxococcus sp. NMCA1]|uniref:hypothetical protein n=1 Tax=Myxococcus sp. NMCA1 TaxID=2996785 RepID=UPI0022867C26|nr:hypothetical protein [Myxococcus sp. NMCA1]WAM25160.1 hypothetical protein OZ403_32225 [Myxococcus sp. NMCA1]